eukprot:Nitzschia sp. Nitz4//scaffold11_size288233//66962//73286//NITZ4_000748-RA/size288233-processed-gene-0.147-mRNA-1//1//CDS//3329533996//1227//frame0
MGNEVSSPENEVHRPPRRRQSEDLESFARSRSASLDSTEFYRAPELQESASGDSTEQRAEKPNFRRRQKAYEGGSLKGNLAAVELPSKAKPFVDPVLSAATAGGKAKREKQAYLVRQEKERLRQEEEDRIQEKIRLENEWKTSLHRLATLASSTATNVAHVTAPVLKDATTVLKKSAKEFATDVREEWNKPDEPRFQHDEESVMLFPPTPGGFASWRMGSARSFDVSPSATTPRVSRVVRPDFPVFPALQTPPATNQPVRLFPHHDSTPFGTEVESNSDLVATPAQEIALPRLSYLSSPGVMKTVNEGFSPERLVSDMATELDSPQREDQTPKATNTSDVSNDDAITEGVVVDTANKKTVEHNEEGASTDSVDDVPEKIDSDKSASKSATEASVCEPQTTGPPHDSTTQDKSGENEQALSPPEETHQEGERKAEAPSQTSLDACVVNEALPKNAGTDAVSEVISKDEMSKETTSVSNENKSEKKEEGSKDIVASLRSTIERRLKEVVPNQQFSLFAADDNAVYESHTTETPTQYPDQRNMKLPAIFPGKDQIALAREFLQEKGVAFQRFMDDVAKQVEKDEAISSGAEVVDTTGYVRPPPIKKSIFETEVKKHVRSTQSVESDISQPEDKSIEDPEEKQQEEELSPYSGGNQYWEMFPPSMVNSVDDKNGMIPLSIGNIGGSSIFLSLETHAMSLECTEEQQVPVPDISDHDSEEKNGSAEDADTVIEEGKSTQNESTPSEVATNANQVSSTSGVDSNRPEPLTVGWEISNQDVFQGIPDGEEISEAFEPQDGLDEALLAFSSLANVEFVRELSSGMELSGERAAISGLAWQCLVARWKHDEVWLALMAGPTTVQAWENTYSVTDLGTEEDSISSTATGNFPKGGNVSLVGAVAEQFFPKSVEGLPQGGQRTGTQSLSAFLCALGPKSFGSKDLEADNAKAIRHHFPKEISKKDPHRVDIHEALKSVASYEIVLARLIENVAEFTVPNDGVGPVEACGSVTYSVGSKDAEAATAKAARKYEGDLTRVLDLLRAEITFSNEGSLVCALYRLAKLVESGVEIASTEHTQKHSIEVVRFKNLFRTAPCGSPYYSPLPTGYRHVLVNIRFDSGIVAEIQFQLAPYYNVLRSEGYELHQQIVNSPESKLKDQSSQSPVVHNNYNVIEFADRVMGRTKSAILDKMNIEAAKSSKSALSTIHITPGPVNSKLAKVLSGPPAGGIATMAAEAATKKNEVAQGTSGPPAGGIAAMAAAAAAKKNAAAQDSSSPPAGGIAAMAAAAAAKKNAAAQESSGPPAGGIAAMAAAAAAKKNAAAQDSSGPPAGGIAAMAAAAAAKKNAAAKESSGPPAGGIAAMAAAAAAKKNAAAQESSGPPAGGIAAMAAAAAAKKNAAAKESSGPPAGGIAAMAAAAAAKKNAAAQETSGPPGGGIAAMAAAAAAKKNAAAQESSGPPAGGIAAMAAAAAAKKNAAAQDSTGPPAGGIAAMAAAAAAKRNADAQADVVPPGGGVAALAAAAAATKLQSPLDGAPADFPAVPTSTEGEIEVGLEQETATTHDEPGFTSDTELLGAVLHVGAAVAEDSPRDFSTFYCLYLLSRHLGNEASDETPSPFHLALNKSELESMEKRLLLRSLEISNQATSVGMVGWLEYGISNTLERTQSLPFEVLQQLAYQFASKGDWESASDVLSGLVLRCEQGLAGYDPTAITAMLDLVASSAMAGNDWLSQGMLSRVSNLHQLFLTEYETLYIEKCRSITNFARNAQTVMLDSLPDVLVLMKSFAMTLHKQLSRELITQILCSHPVVWINHSLVADSFALLANCLGASEEPLDPGRKRRHHVQRESSYYWTMAYSHYQHALRGWLCIVPVTHPYAAGATIAVARCLRELGMLDKALKLLETLVSELKGLVDVEEKGTTSDPKAPRMTFLSPNRQRRFVFSVGRCRNEQTLVAALWTMAVLTVEHSPDERGRIRALSLLHAASEALRRCLEQTPPLDPETRNVCLDLYECIEDEARVLYEPMQLVDVPGGIPELLLNRSAVAKMTHDVWTPMRRRREQPSEAKKAEWKKKPQILMV